MPWWLVGILLRMKCTRRDSGEKTLEDKGAVSSSYQDFMVFDKMPTHAGSQLGTNDTNIDGVYCSEEKTDSCHGRGCFKEGLKSKQKAIPKKKKVCGLCSSPREVKHSVLHVVESCFQKERS